MSEIVVNISSAGCAATGVTLIQGPAGPTGPAGGPIDSLAKSANLSDLTNAGTARNNLGLGSAAVQPANAFDASGAAAAAQAAAIAACPAETATTLGALISGATAKTTPVDPDTLGLSDSAASNVLKKLTWANAKATLKTYFDSLYQAAGSYVTPGGALGTPSSGNLANCTGAVDARIPTSGNTVGNVPAFTSTDGQLGTSPISVSGSNVKIGLNASRVGDDSALLINRTATNALASGGSHCLRDESTYSPAASGGYASFDSIPYFSGAASDHIHSFQSRPQITAGSISEVSGLKTGPTVSGGSVTNVYGVHVSDALGGGTINQQFGVWIDSLTAGAANYGIYQNGSSPNYFGGLVQVGSEGVTSSGPLKGSNFYAEPNTNTVGLGVGIPAISYPTTVPGYLCTFIGHGAGAGISAANQANYSTIIGAGAGTTGHGSRNVFLGCNAGYYETGSERLIIDNRSRGDEATARAQALIYGVFDADPANQKLTINGNVGIGTASPTVALDVNADTARLRNSKTPASSSAAGNAGEMCWDSSYLYICTATNTWRRIAHATW